MELRQLRFLLICSTEAAKYRELWRRGSCDTGTARLNESADCIVLYCIIIAAHAVFLRSQITSVKNRLAPLVFPSAIRTASDGK